MEPVSDETKIALLEKRMGDVEKFVEAVPDKYVTKNEVETMIAQAVPSVEQIKDGMSAVLLEHLSGDATSRRSMKVEVIKAISYVIGGGGVVAILSLLTAAPKG